MGVFLSFCWASEEKNLLNIPADKSPETIWTEVHNKEFQGDFSVDPQGGASGGPCLKINALPADAGEAHPYGEWRFKQQPAIEEGVEYAFHAWVKGKVDAPAGAGAYVNIYGFGAQGTPKPFSSANSLSRRRTGRSLKAGSACRRESSGRGSEWESAREWGGSALTASGWPLPPSPRELMISRLRVFAWFALALGIWAGPMCGQEPENLLPGLQVTEGSGLHWEFVRNQEARILGREETSERGQPVLRLEASNAAGYGEWRVSSITRVLPGTPYEARVMVSGHADAPPYIEVYSFNEAGVPRLIGRAAGSAGNLQDELLKCRFTVPPDGVKLRFGTGLSKAEGNLTISRAVLAESVPGRPEPELADAPRRPQAPPPQADWLWVQNDPGLPVLRFRNTFTLEETPTSAIVQITADKRLQAPGQRQARSGRQRLEIRGDLRRHLRPDKRTKHHRDRGGEL